MLFRITTNFKLVITLNFVFPDVTWKNMYIELYYHVLEGTETHFDYKKNFIPRVSGEYRAHIIKPVSRAQRFRNEYSCGAI